MAAQNLPPTSIAVQTNLTGSVTDIDESPASPDANWLTASGSPTLRVLFDTPTMAPAGTQTFRAYLRRTNNGTYSQTLYPEATFTTALSNSGGSSTLDCINEDQNGFATSYLYPTASNQGISACPFPTPSMSGNPSGTQTIRLYCGKYKIGTGLDQGGSGVPTVSVAVYDGATPVTTTGGTQNVSGLGWLSWTFTAPANDGSGINIVVTCTSNGGGPNSRSVAIDSIQWQAVGAGSVDYDLDVYENGVKVGDVSTGSVTSTTGELTSGGWNSTVLGTADGSLVELYITQTSGTEYLEIGAVEWVASTGAKGTLYAGNSTDGATLLYTSAPSKTNPFDTIGPYEVYSENPAVVPTGTEYGRAGFGVSASNEGVVDATALILMVLDAPNAGYSIHDSGGLTETDAAATNSSTSTIVASSFNLTTASASGTSTQNITIASVSLTAGTIESSAIAQFNSAIVFQSEGDSTAAAITQATISYISQTIAESAGAAVSSKQAASIFTSSYNVACSATVTGLSEASETTAVATGSSITNINAAAIWRTDTSSIAQATTSADSGALWLVAAAAAASASVNGVSQTIARTDANASGASATTGVATALASTTLSATGQATPSILSDELQTTTFAVAGATVATGVSSAAALTQGAAAGSATSNIEAADAASGAVAVDANAFGTSAVTGVVAYIVATVAESFRPIGGGTFDSTLITFDSTALTFDSTGGSSEYVLGITAAIHNVIADSAASATVTGAITSILGTVAAAQGQAAISSVSGAYAKVDINAAGLSTVTGDAVDANSSFIAVDANATASSATNILASATSGTVGASAATSSTNFLDSIVFATILQAVGISATSILSANYYNSELAATGSTSTSFATNYKVASNLASAGGAVTSFEVSYTFNTVFTEANASVSTYSTAYTLPTEAQSIGIATVFGYPPALFEQEGFRFRNNNGDEISATWKGLQDTNTTENKEVILRLRMLTSVIGSPGPTQVTLQYKRSDEAETDWRTV